jgi:hypothetical protein
VTTRTPRAAGLQSLEYCSVYNVSINIQKVGISPLAELCCAIAILFIVPDPNSDLVGTMDAIVGLFGNPASQGLDMRQNQHSVFLFSKR